MMVAVDKMAYDFNLSSSFELPLSKCRVIVGNVPGLYNILTTLFLIIIIRFLIFSYVYYFNCSLF